MVLIRNLLATTNNYNEPKEKDKLSISSTVEIPLLSSYVWRGQVINNSVVLQPSLTFELCSLSINIWNNFNLTDNDATSHLDEKYDFTETDLTLSYSCKLDCVTISAGIIEYLFPNTTVLTKDEKGYEQEKSYPSTRECFFGVALTDTKIVPSIFVYYDIGEVQGFYGNAGVLYSKELLERLTISLGANCGYANSDYNDYYFACSKNAFNDANFTLKAECFLNRYLAIVPSLQYTYLLDSDIRNAADEIYFHSSRFVAGCALKGAF